jgi:hypothetical protein
MIGETARNFSDNIVFDLMRDVTESAAVAVLIQRNWHFSDLHRSRRRPVLVPNIPLHFTTDFSGVFEGRFSVLKPLGNMFRALQIV